MQKFITESQQTIIADPQTSGGLLIAVDPNYVNEFENVCKERNTKLSFIGNFIDKKENKVLTVI